MKDNCKVSSQTTGSWQLLDARRTRQRVGRPETPRREKSLGMELEGAHVGTHPRKQSTALLPADFTLQVLASNHPGSESTPELPIATQQPVGRTRSCSFRAKPRL